MRGRIRRGPLFAVMLLLTLLLASTAGAQAFRNLKEGDKAFPVSLKDAEGKDGAFSPDSGKVTVLAFIKSGQDRSQALVKDLAALRAELAPKGVDFVVVASYTDTPDEMKKAAADLGAQVLLDKDQKAYSDYGLFILPTAAVIGKDGKYILGYAGHSHDFRNVLGGRVKVLAGLMTEDEYKKLNTTVETVQKSKEESEAERLMTLGNTLVKRGMCDKAIEKFSKAVELDPKNAGARTAFGECLIAAKKPDEAKAQFEKAKELDPRSKDAQLGLGMVHLEKGETDKAIEVISEAAMLNPKPAKANYWLGAAYEKKGDLQNAVKFYKKAIEKLLKD
jgi:tetratricopeptide (TPR) repeat protein